MKIFLRFLPLAIMCSFCQKKESVERNTLVFNDNIDSVRVVLHKMNMYLKKLPSPLGDNPHNYYLDDSIIFVNGEKIGRIGNVSLNNITPNLKGFLEQNPDFLRLIYILNENGVTANIPYINCENSLFYYRPTIENHRGDGRYIAIVDSISCNYFGSRRDSVLDRYKDICLIADKSNPIYSTE